MGVLETDTYEDIIPEIDDSFQEDPLQYASGKLLRCGVGLAFILYGVIAFATDIGTGFYAIKISMLIISGLLLFSPASYPYLLGLLVAVYYMLKSPYIPQDYQYAARFASVMIILMAVFHWVWKHLGDYRRNPYQHFDLGTFCLLGIFGVAILGGIGVESRFLYFTRMVDILAFGCAFYLGRSCLNIQQSLRLLLIGIALGIVAFVLPFSLGYVLRHGFGVLGRLDILRGELGGEPLGSESGNVLMFFALAYSLSGSGVSPKVKRIALWLVAIPAVIVVLIYLSRGAIFLLPVTVFLSFVFSGRRRVAIVAALVIAVVGIVVYIKMPALFVSIGERMAEITKSAITRYDIRILGIELGMSHPLLGIGAGQFRALTEFATAHNEGLNILAEHGIAALLLYILFWIYIAYMALKLRLHRDLLMRSLAGVFLVIMPIYLAYAQIQPMYFNRGGALFAFCLGMLVTLYYRSKDEDRVHGSL